jgi:predicted metalloprotease with PDZ domain
MGLEVDATDLERRIFRVRQTIPVAQPGPVTLLYPQWLPGNHAPRGQVDRLAGLVIRANGQVVPWTRDAGDVFAFHVEVPAGAAVLEAEFQFLTPTASDQGRVLVTPDMLNLQWEDVALYPAGYFTRRIMVEPSVRLPPGFSQASALEVKATEASLVRFRPVSFETLVDSPIFAGRYFKTFDLDPGGRRAPVRLNVMADSPEQLQATPEQIEAHRQMVRQADKLFGTRQFDRYDFLLALTERMGGIGLEHHRSSENGTVTNYFTEWGKSTPARDLLPHEYTHSWNGKFRRPADLWTPDYRTPMRNSLLWVYEGQTQYWGHVLAARAGLISRQDALDALAMTAAAYENRVGRAWRELSDTVNDPIAAARRPNPWLSWQRSEDYYSEGQLVWLDVDTLIRERSSGRRSLDDFARGFFGLRDGAYTPVTYTFDDVVAALNKVEPYDWTSFLNRRVNEIAPKAPLDGLARGGYRLVYGETPTEYWKNNEARRKAADLSYSIGLSVAADGRIAAVQWEGPAFKAGLAVGGRILAVNGMAYDTERLKSAITAAKGGAPVSLIVQTGDFFRTVAVDYRGGLRYPRLERIAGAPARLDQLFAARN